MASKTMNWINQYQLFLFDFDGLLVNTEELHYQAYIRMCAKHGVNLNWNFHSYAELAHRSATGVKEKLYAEFPNLTTFPWEILYEEKKQALIDLLKEGAATLMPGVQELLLALQERQIKRCVVTHSALRLIQIIREQNPILNTIPYWITREDYSKPKPNSECYQVAINRYANEKDHIIGFEDSPRGFSALIETKAVPVLICPREYPYPDHFLTDQIIYYPSFTDITERNSPRSRIDFFRNSI